ncbi:dethiobiotin synthase [Tundrisphaera sp. TA3]|uniref:dethiobiotin synthase n=1 Tax=Tundrisphaera sp. TA3 TaxID=3435775 RepID=UPI003EBFE803
MNDLPGLFVVGTDTGVGKTRVASRIARSWAGAGRRVGVLKPVATGAEVRDGRWISEDAEALRAAIGPAPLDRVCPLLYEEPLAPPVAARRAGAPLLWDELARAVLGSLEWWSTRAEVMVVEGVGGLLCPIAEGATVADMAIALDYPLLVVAHRGLGTINHTLMTVEAARSRGLRVAGVLLNGARPTADPVAEATNAEELSRRLGGVAILGEWPHRPGEASPILPGPVDAGVLTWYALAMMSRTGDPRRAWRID